MMLTRRHSTLMVALVCLALTGCSLDGATRTGEPGRVISPQQVYRGFAWASNQKLEPTVMQSVRVTRSASHHFLRVRTAQQPHVYDHRDLVFTVLSGGLRLHQGTQGYDLRPGDVVDLPRGTVFWLENTAPEASEAYVVVTPPLQGGEARVIDPTRGSGRG